MPHREENRLDLAPFEAIPAHPHHRLGRVDHDPIAVAGTPDVYEHLQLGLPRPHQQVRPLDRHAAGSKHHAQAMEELGGGDTGPTGSEEPLLDPRSQLVRHGPPPARR